MAEKRYAALSNISTKLSPINQSGDQGETSAMRRWTLETGGGCCSTNSGGYDCSQGTVLPDPILTTGQGGSLRPRYV